MASPHQNTEDLGEESKSINKELLQTAIRSKEGRNDILVKEFSVKQGNMIGENFTSATFRVSVTVDLLGKEHVHNLFIKVMSNHPYLKRYHVENKIFHKETMAYCQIIPDMIKFQKECGVEPFGISVPQFYYSVVDDTNGIIIVEDLGPRGYILANKVDGLTYEQCKIVIRNLAAFHSLSYAAKARDRNNLNKYEYLFKESFLTQSAFNTMKAFLNPNLELVKHVTDDPRIEECAKKILSLDLEITFNKLLEQEEPFALICHGDMWCNNVLFKYEEGDDTTHLSDVKLIDWQLIRYALPATDLAYFFFTSMTRRARAEHMADLVRLYYCSFMDSLKKHNLSFDEFTMDVLEKQLKEKMLFGVIMACIAIPGILTKTEQFQGSTDTEIKEFAKNIANALLQNPDNVKIINERLLGALEDAVDMNLL